MKKLMDLIEEGDPEAILSEENFYPHFNDLLKYNMIVIKDEKIFLTEKGKKAKTEGLEEALKLEKNALLQEEYFKKQEIKQPFKGFFNVLRDKRIQLLQLFLLLLAFLPFFQKTRKKSTKVGNTRWFKN